MNKSPADPLPALEASPAPAQRRCDVIGCPGEGLHRAPKAPTRLNEYFWFCLDHIREYNKTWDFCAGMSPAEIEAMVRWDTTWQRPTFPLGWWRTQERLLREAAAQGFTFGRGGDGPGFRSGPETPGGSPPLSPEEEAMKVLELDPPVDMPQVKARYRELVKRNHPDANGGDKAAEERLKRINQAYTTLKIKLGG